VELKLKTPWRDGTAHLVMPPMEFMRRLAALVPRPRLHPIRLQCERRTLGVQMYPSSKFHH
jgi:Putative transposase